MRILLSLILTMLMLLPAIGQETASETPWRAAIDGQIQALRANDGAAALAFAGAAFRAIYKDDPAKFAGDITRSGYGPITQSRSHSFGAFRQVAPGAAVQVVEFVDRDGRVWEALYQLADEDGEGWRVEGVVLRGTAGLGV